MVRVKDLPENANGVFQFCRKCGGRYSANRADYFLASPDTVLTCDNGHEPTEIILARAERNIVEVS